MVLGLSTEDKDQGSLFWGMVQKLQRVAYPGPCLPEDAAMLPKAQVPGC